MVKAMVEGVDFVMIIWSDTIFIFHWKNSELIGASIAYQEEAELDALGRDAYKL